MLSSPSRLIEAEDLTADSQIPGIRAIGADIRRAFYYCEVLPRVGVTVTRAHEDVTTTLIVGVQRPQVA